MSYADEVRRWQVKVEAKPKEVLAALVPALKASIVEGSPLTGAPGQPVDTGALRNSWQEVFAPDFSSATIGTNLNYAPVIEYGRRSAFDPKGQSAEELGLVSGGGGRTRNRAFGVTGGQVGPSEGGDRVTLRSALGGFRSVQITVTNADNVLQDILKQVTA